MADRKTYLLNLSLFIYTAFVYGQSNNPLFKIDEAKTQRIDSLIKFNTDEIKLQYLAVLPSVSYNF
jgi:hypothetical protein